MTLTMALVAITAVLVVGGVGGVVLGLTAAHILQRRRPDLFDDYTVWDEHDSDQGR